MPIQKTHRFRQVLCLSLALAFLPAIVFAEERDPKAQGLMERWAYFLQGWEEGREPTHWQWLDWGRYGRIMLSPRRLNPDPENGGERMLSEIAVFDHLPDSVFESPAPVIAE